MVELKHGWVIESGDSCNKCDNGLCIMGKQHKWKSGNLNDIKKSIKKWSNWADSKNP